MNMAVHAPGNILSLPHMLEDDETVEYVSLGAGKKGKLFELEDQSARRRDPPAEFVLQG
jgi:hypothetical protein